MHAKWAFVLLAVVFALGFVFFGVGSGSTGISDALQNAFNFGTSGGTSISKLQKKADKHPSDATAWRDLATALEQKQRTQEAVNALERYTALRPKDQGALAELASQYGTLATNYATDYAERPAAEAEQASPAAAFAPAFDDPVRQGVRRPDRAAGPDRGRGRRRSPREAADGLLELPERAAERRGRVPAARRPEPERRDDADPARPGRAGRQRHDDRDRGIQGVPQARADRSARAPGQAGAEALQAQAAAGASTSTGG